MDCLASFAFDRQEVPTRGGIGAGPKPEGRRGGVRFRH